MLSENYKIYFSRSSLSTVYNLYWKKRSNVKAIQYVFGVRTKGSLIYDKKWPIGQIDFPEKITVKNQSSLIFSLVCISKYFDFFFSNLTCFFKVKHYLCSKTVYFCMNFVLESSG